MQDFRFSPPTGDLSALYARVGGREKLARLLHHFYADVRQHRLLGPVFNSRIKNWPEHLDTIAAFWSRVAGGPSNYSGQMPVKHLNLGIAPEHFEAWLQLWEANCRAYLDGSASEEMISLARDIARRLIQRIQLAAMS